jgi:ABC-type polysaccharide/polyol phosphate export permease
MRAFDKQYRNLLREIASCQFKLKDQSTFLGLFWSLLNPLLVLLVLLLFFSLNAGAGVPHYGIYLLIGVIQFTHFSNSTSGAMTSLTSMRQLTCDSVLPKEVLVIGAVLSTTIEFVISMSLGVAIAYFAGVRITWLAALIPLVIVMQMLTVLWISFVLACLHAFVRDIGHIYHVFLRILFFVTPIFYTPRYLGRGAASYIVSLNPLARLIGFSRAVLMDGTVVPLKTLGIFSGVNLLAVAVAFAIFKHYEARFAELV